MSSCSTTTTSRFNMRNIFSNSIPSSSSMSNLLSDSPRNPNVLHKTATPLPMLKDRLNNKSQLIFSSMEKNSIKEQQQQIKSLLTPIQKELEEPEKEALKNWLIGKTDLTVESFIKKTNNDSNIGQPTAQRRSFRPSKFQPENQDSKADSFDSILANSTAKTNLPETNNDNGTTSSNESSNNQFPTKTNQIRSTQRNNSSNTQGDSSQKNYIVGCGSLQLIRLPKILDKSANNEESSEENKGVLRRPLGNQSIVANGSLNKISNEQSNETNGLEEKDIQMKTTQNQQKPRRPSIELHVEVEQEVSPLKRIRRMQPASCSDIQQFQGVNSSNDTEKDSPQRGREMFYRKSSYKTNNNSSLLSGINQNNNNNLLPSINLQNHRAILEAQTNKLSPSNSNGSNFNSPINGNNSILINTSTNVFNLSKSKYAINNSFQLSNNVQREPQQPTKLIYESDQRIPSPQAYPKQPRSQFGQSQQFQQQSSFQPFAPQMRSLQFISAPEQQSQSQIFNDSPSMLNDSGNNASQDFNLNKSLMHTRRFNRHLQPASVGGGSSFTTFSDKDQPRNSQSPKSILKPSASKSRFFSSASKKAVIFNEKVTQYVI